ncbi:MAG: transglycosylase domain-containing protein [Pseudomonadota bacterium]
MSDSRKKRPLVADRRYPKDGTKSRRTQGKKPARKPRKRTPQRGFLSRVLRAIFRLIWVVTSRVAIIAFAALLLAVGYFYTTLPPVTDLLDGRARGSVTMLDRDGAVFAWRGDQFGGAVTADTVSPALRDAIVATEDKRFYRHIGVSPRGIASAVRINLREGRGPLSGHGGSTITQQTAKLLCLGREYDPSEWESEAAYVRDCRAGSLQRKAHEAIYALAMEAKYTKDEILSIYMNRAYMGGGAYGAEAAAQRFFGKPASAVSPAEGAMLAGLLTAPSTLSPTANLQRSRDRAATVLRLMGEQGYLTPEQVAFHQQNPASLSEAAAEQAGGYFADWVMQSGPEYFTRNTAEDVIIATTLDQRLQKAAEEALAHIFETKVRPGSKAQAAIVVMDASGAVRAMVGGRQTQVAGVFNRAIQANRQTGSAFKPFVYAAALNMGYDPLDTVVDAPLTIDIPGSGPWTPKNYTNDFKGEVTMSAALMDSLNIPAVKVSESVGREEVRRVASEFGIFSDLAAGPALALGASESTLLEMTGAYAGILAGGSEVTPYGLVALRLAAEEEPLMGIGGGVGKQVVSPEAAGQLIWMMEKVVSEGTGARAQFDGREIAGKTGTTQAARDAWFIGFTADYVAGVWMGYDDNTPLTGVTGGGLPAEIWRETMIRVHEGVPPRPLPLVPPRGATRAATDTPQTTEGIIEGLLRDILGGGGGSGARGTDPSGGER